jgi:predicted nucleic acid-binding protein/tetratricopeptide (TPR) repeat protein
LAERVAIMLLRIQDRVGQRDTTIHMEAAGLLAQVAVESLAIDQPDTALRIDARLVGVLCRAGRQELLGRLIEWWLENDVDRRAAEARNAVALSLLDCNEPQLARRIAPTDPGPEPAGQLMSARLALESEQPDQLSKAVTLLDELLIDEQLDPFTRTQAARTRLLAAADFDADWSEQAAELVADEKPLYVAALRAAHLSGRGQTKEAETILLPFTDTPDGKRALTDLLARQEQWARVVGLIDSLGPETSADDQMRRADALMRLSKAEQAEQAWRQMVDQERLPYLRREHAAFRLASSLSERQQWEQLAEFAARWHRLLPASPKAPWAAAEALARIGKPVEALTLLDEAEVTPQAAVERHLMAQLAAQSLPLPDALQRIADLSDATDRQDELLESMLITVSAGQDMHELSAELEARVGHTYADFTQRFPDSKLIWSEKIDDDATDWIRRLEEHGKRRRQYAQDIEDQVVNGRGALALLSLLGKRPLEVWMLARVLPLAYPRADEQQAEQAAADSAITGAASWDVSVLAISSLLDEDLASLLSFSLPASMLARAAFTEVSHAQAGLAELDPARSAGTLAFDELTGRPQLIGNDLQTLETMRARLQRVAAMANRLTVRDPDAGGEAELARALRNQELDPSAGTWLGAVALAQQAHVPFFSDDRYLRRCARQMGLPSFGTVALLGALAERGALSAKRYRTVLWQLRAHGGRYIPLLGGELIDQLQADGFKISDATAATLLAPEGWGIEPNELLTAWHEALAATFVAQPDRLHPSVEAVLRMSSRGRGSSLSSAATVLVLSAMALPSPPVGYMRAFLSDLRRSYTSLQDPVDLAMASLAQQARGQPDASAIVLRAFTRLPLAEQMRLLS